MPCCAPRYGVLIVGIIDSSAGLISLILLVLGQNSKLALVSLALPASILPWLGIILIAAFVKKHRCLASLGLGIKIVLIIGCVAIAVLLMTQPDLSSNSYSPVFIAALCYTILLQLHFSWVIYDFKSRRLGYQQQQQQHESLE